jgi:hypothetical protein
MRARLAFGVKLDRLNDSAEARDTTFEAQSKDGDWFLFTERSPASLHLEFAIAAV